MIKQIILLLMVLFLMGCKTDSESGRSTDRLTFISDHPLQIEDPSGLTLDVSGNFLWTVSDQSGG